MIFLFRVLEASLTQRGYSKFNKDDLYSWKHLEARRSYCIIDMWVTASPQTAQSIQFGVWTDGEITHDHFHDVIFQ